MMKRDVIFGVGSFLVAFVSMIVLAASQTTAQDGSLHATFDTISLPGWRTTPDVIVKDGALYMPPANSVNPPGTWEDMTVTLRLKQSGEGGLAFTYRASPTGTYILGVASTQINLGREESGAGSPLGHSAPLTIPDNTWFEITIVVVGGEHWVELNGETVLTVTDPNPLPAGEVGFETTHQVEVAIDEITVTSNTSTTPPSAETTAEAMPVDLSGCETYDGFAFCRDIQYSDDGHNNSLALDLYLPTNTGTASPPVLVHIHGGGWFEGSKDTCPGTTFAQNGYAVACVDYRLATGDCVPDRVFPAQIHDIKAAVRWLRQHATMYGYDADRIGAIGESSGGHLAALLGVSGDVPDLEGSTNLGTSSAVQAVVDWYGPVDIRQGPMVFEDNPCITNIVALSDIYGGEDVPYFYWTFAWGVFLGGSLTDPATLEQAVQATPLTYVDANDPPFLIVHGEIDGMVPIEQSALLADAVAAEGVDVTFIRPPYLGHGYGSPDEEVFPDLLRLTLQFLDTHLKNN